MKIQRGFALVNRSFLKAIIILHIIFITSCTTKWFYNHIDWFLLWKIDDFFDLSSEQETLLEPVIQEHLKWHKKEGLLQHIEFLQALQERMQHPLTPEDVDWFVEAYQQQLYLLFGRIISDMARFVVTLPPEQIQYFEQTLEKSNKKLKERLALLTEEWLQLRAEKTVEYLEDWVGDLSDDQVAEVIRLSKTIPDTFEYWYNRRIKRQQHFIGMLRSRKTRAEIEQTLQNWYIHTPLRPLSQSYPPIRDMALKVDHMLTPEQRQHRNDEVQKWIERLKGIHEG